MLSKIVLSNTNFVSIMERLLIFYFDWSETKLKMPLEHLIQLRGKLNH